MANRYSRDLPLFPTEWNGKYRNEILFGWTPQAEIRKGHFAIIGFFAYLFWYLAGYSVVRDVLCLVSY